MKTIFNVQFNMTLGKVNDSNAILNPTIEYNNKTIVLGIYNNKTVLRINGK